MSILRSFLWAALAASLVVPVWANDAQPQAVRRAPFPVQVDGLLDDPAWAAAARFELSYETEPGENVAAPVGTECLLTYDERNLYVAFRALEPEPGLIRAHLSDRDTAWQDDYVGVVLDTFNDERRAFEFYVNPLGIQMDRFYDGVADSHDLSWDGIWASAGRLREDGYAVEMAIPFHSLRFPRAEGEQVWGIDLVRFHPREQARRLAVNPLDRNQSCYLCQTLKVSGFQGADSGLQLEVNPTVTATRTDARESFGADLKTGDTDSDLGLTLRWGITSDLTLSAAVNPDFSQVEADAAQLAVNTQFALFFPEKRPFFLDDADVFSSPTNLVFTRNVADPEWGVKLTGKHGPHAIGVFSAVDRVTNLIFPGSESSDATSLDLETTDSIFRYRRDVGQASVVGALVTDREGRGYHNRVGGLDGTFRIGPGGTLGLQYLRSDTLYPETVARDFGQPLDAFTDDAYQAYYIHESRSWAGQAVYQDFGAGFRGDLGFLPQVDIRLFQGRLERIWWGSGDAWYTRAAFGAEWDSVENQRGGLLERESEVWLHVNGPWQSFFGTGIGREDIAFGGKVFDHTFRWVKFEMKPTRTFSFWFVGRTADVVDYANIQSADQIRAEPIAELNLGRRTRLRLQHTFERLDVAGGRLFQADLSQLWLTYQFNTRAFVRGIAQLSDVERNPALYTVPVDAESSDLFGQLLFSYKLNPRTVLFLGYVSNNAEDPLRRLTEMDRTFFFKVGYALVL